MVTNSGSGLIQQSSIKSVSQNSEHNIRRTNFHFFSISRCQHQHFCRTPPDRIRTPHPSLPTALHYKICSQKQFLDSPEQYNQRNWTTMGPNTRIEAIRDDERDILDSLKRLSKFTTEMSTKKLQAMPYDVFTRKQVALPQFKRLCNRTIRVERLTTNRTKAHKARLLLQTFRRICGSSRHAK